MHDGRPALTSLAYLLPQISLPHGEWHSFLPSLTHGVLRRNAARCCIHIQGASPDGSPHPRDSTLFSALSNTCWAPRVSTRLRTESGRVPSGYQSRDHGYARVCTCKYAQVLPTGYPATQSHFLPDTLCTDKKQRGPILSEACATHWVQMKLEWKFLAVPHREKMF